MHISSCAALLVIKKQQQILLSKTTSCSYVNWSWKWSYFVWRHQISVCILHMYLSIKTYVDVHFPFLCFRACNFHLHTSHSANNSLTPYFTPTGSGYHEYKIKILLFHQGLGCVGWQHDHEARRLTSELSNLGLNLCSAIMLSSWCFTSRAIPQCCVCQPLDVRYTDVPSAGIK